MESDGLEIVEFEVAWEKTMTRNVGNHQDIGR